MIATIATPAYHHVLSFSCSSAILKSSYSLYYFIVPFPQREPLTKLLY
jgi:hypothetical protein